MYLLAVFLWYSEKSNLTSNFFPLELIKRRSKVDEKNMLRERDIDFEQ